MDKGIDLIPQLKMIAGGYDPESIEQITREKAKDVIFEIFNNDLSDVVFFDGDRGVTYQDGRNRSNRVFEGGLRISKPSVYRGNGLCFGSMKHIEALIRDYHEFLKGNNDQLEVDLSDSDYEMRFKIGSGEDYTLIDIAKRSTKGIYLFREIDVDKKEQLLIENFEKQLDIKPSLIDADGKNHYRFRKNNNNCVIINFDVCELNVWVEFPYSINSQFLEPELERMRDAYSVEVELKKYTPNKLPERVGVVNFKINTSDVAQLPGYLNGLLLLK